MRTWPLNENPGAFGGLEAEPDFERARFAVLPLAYDGTATWQKGTAAGPEAILAASANMELYDIETGTEPWRQGIATLAPVAGCHDPAAMVAKIREIARELLEKKKFVVGLGGEHSVSIGLIQAYAERYPGLSVLQLDAHADLRDEYEGSPFSHACVMARVAEVCDFVQVGIRSMDISERVRLDPARCFFAHQIAKNPHWREDAVSQLGDPVYITIDLDVLDPAEMPSTGTPEPGGMRYRQVVDLLSAVCRERTVVGFDIVELMPGSHNKAPDFLAARLTYQLMAFLTPVP